MSIVVAVVIGCVAGMALGWLLERRRHALRQGDQDCAVAEEDAHLPDDLRPHRELYVAANADEAELKRLYGEDVLIHRSDR